jgi:hypothetical protein
VAHESFQIKSGSSAALFFGSRRDGHDYRRRADAHATVVGADSLVGVEGTGKEYECKINLAGKIYFAAAGIDDVPASHFYYEGLAIRAIKYSSNLSDAAKLFEDSVKDPFAQALEDIRRNAPKYYAEKIHTSAEPLQVLFLTIENGLAKYVLVYLTVQENPTGHLEVSTHRKTCPGDCRQDDGNVILGFSEEIEKATADLSFWRGVASNVDAIRKMITIEEKAHPLDVGGDIDILTLDGSGAHWASPANKCK